MEKLKAIRQKSRLAEQILTAPGYLWVRPTPLTDEQKPDSGPYHRAMNVLSNSADAYADIEREGMKERRYTGAAARYMLESGSNITLKYDQERDAYFIEYRGELWLGVENKHLTTPPALFLDPFAGPQVEVPALPPAPAVTTPAEPDLLNVADMALSPSPLWENWHTVQVSLSLMDGATLSLDNLPRQAVSGYAADLPALRNLAQELYDRRAELIKAEPTLSEVEVTITATRLYGPSTFTQWLPAPADDTVGGYGLQRETPNFHIAARERTYAAYLVDAKNGSEKGESYGVLVYKMPPELEGYDPAFTLYGIDPAGQAEVEEHRSAYEVGGARLVAVYRNGQRIAGYPVMKKPVDVPAAPLADLKPGDVIFNPGPAPARIGDVLTAPAPLSPAIPRLGLSETRPPASPSTRTISTGGAAPFYDWLRQNAAPPSIFAAPEKSAALLASIESMVSIHRGKVGPEEAAEMALTGLIAAYDLGVNDAEQRAVQRLERALERVSESDFYPNDALCPIQGAMQLAFNAGVKKAIAGAAAEREAHPMQELTVTVKVPSMVRKFAELLDAIATDLGE